MAFSLSSYASESWFVGTNITPLPATSARPAAGPASLNVDPEHAFHASRTGHCNAACRVDAAQHDRLDAVADRLVIGAHCQCAQSCIGVQRFFVHAEVDDAPRQINDSRYGLQAGIFRRDIGRSDDDDRRPRSPDGQPGSVARRPRLSNFCRAGSWPPP